MVPTVSLGLKGPATWTALVAMAVPTARLARPALAVRPDQRAPAAPAGTAVRQVIPEAAYRQRRRPRWIHAANGGDGADGTAEHLDGAERR